MTTIDFYKFIHENAIEFHWYQNPESKQRDVLFFPYYWQIEYLAKLLKPTDFDDEGITVVVCVRFCLHTAINLHGITQQN
jgi:hypothetical protein